MSECVKEFDDSLTFTSIYVSLMFVLISIANDIMTLKMYVYIFLSIFPP